jgi:hypothetical protein
MHQFDIGISSGHGSNECAYRAERFGGGRGVINGHKNAGKMELACPLIDETA